MPLADLEPLLAKTLKNKNIWEMSKQDIYALLPEPARQALDNLKNNTCRVGWRGSNLIEYQIEADARPGSNTLYLLGRLMEYFPQLYSISHGDSVPLVNGKTGTPMLVRVWSD
jgi:hypothetical protein